MERSARLGLDSISEGVIDEAVRETYPA